MAANKPSDTRFQENIEKALVEYVKAFTTDEDWPAGIKVEPMMSPDVDIILENFKRKPVPHNGMILIGFFLEHSESAGETERLKFNPHFIVIAIMKTSESEGNKVVRRYLQRIMNEFYAVGIRPIGLYPVKDEDKSLLVSAREFWVPESVTQRRKFEKQFDATLWYD